MLWWNSEQGDCIALSKSGSLGNPSLKSTRDAVRKYLWFLALSLGKCTGENYSSLSIMESMLNSPVCSKRKASSKVCTSIILESSLKALPFCLTSQCILNQKEKNSPLRHCSHERHSSWISTSCLACGIIIFHQEGISADIPTARMWGTWWFYHNHYHFETWLSRKWGTLW